MNTLLYSLVVLFCMTDYPGSLRAQDAMQFPQKENDYQGRSYKGHLEPDDFQWLRPAKDYASTRYSTLDQINASNAKNLQVAFTFSTGLERGHEAAPW